MVKFFVDLWDIFSNTSNWSLDNILALVSLLFAVIGGAFAFRQWISSVKVRRTEFLDKCIEKIRFTEDFNKAFYLIEYNPFWYSSDFHGSKNEPIIDGFLSYLCFICYLRKVNNLSKKDMKILQYYLNRTCSSYSVQCYLWNIYHFAKHQDSDCSFQYLIDYGLKYGHISKKEFKNPESKTYVKVLVF